AIDGRRDLEGTDQGAPRAGADERPDFLLLEAVRQRNAALARRLVEYHDLGSIDADGRRWRWRAVAAREVAHQRPRQLVDDVVGDHPALVVALVDDRALLFLLGVIAT